MTRAGAFLLALLMILSENICTAASDPLAEQRKIQKLNAVAAPKDPLAEIQKVQKLNNDQAILFFTAQIKKDPKEASYYAKRGKAYSANKDYEHALPDYDKAVQLDPKLAEPYVGRAVIHLMRKDYDKCWKDVHTAESLGGQFWPSFMEALKKGSGREK